MTLQFFPCSELTIIVKLVSVCASFACKYLNFSTYVCIHTIFQKQRVIWPQMSIVLRLRRPALISHMLLQCTDRNYHCTPVCLSS